VHWKVLKKEKKNQLREVHLPSQKSLHFLENYSKAWKMGKLQLKEKKIEESNLGEP